MIEAKRSESAKRPTLTIEPTSADVNRSINPEYLGAEKQQRTLIGVGLVGVILAVLCCATPVLAVLLPAAGLGAWLSGDYWVLPLLLFVGLGVIAFGLFRRQVRTDPCCETQITKKRG